MDLSSLPFYSHNNSGLDSYLLHVLAKGASMTGSANICKTPTSLQSKLFWENTLTSRSSLLWVKKLHLPSLKPNPLWGRIGYEIVTGQNHPVKYSCPSESFNLSFSRPSLMIWPLHHIIFMYLGYRFNSARAVIKILLNRGLEKLFY